MVGKGRYKKEAKARRKERKREDSARAKERRREAAAVRARLQGRPARERGRVAARGSVRVLRVARPITTKCCCGSRIRAAPCTSTASPRRSSCVSSSAACGCSSPSTRSRRAAAILMACVADHVIAAPFAIVGSIGVVAQLPNFHRLLEEKGVDFEQLTAGRYKRTLTLFGKNTDEGREKLQQEIEDIHELFKNADPRAPAAGRRRPASRPASIGTACARSSSSSSTRCRTSDDFLLEAAKERDLYHLAYKRRRSLPERMLAGAESCCCADGLCRRAGLRLGRLRHTGRASANNNENEDDGAP